MTAEASHPRPRYRVRVFVDFWNYTLSMQEVDASFRTDWARIGPVHLRAMEAALTREVECRRQHTVVAFANLPPD